MTPAWRVASSHPHHHSQRIELRSSKAPHDLSLINKYSAKLKLGEIDYDKFPMGS